MNLFSKKIHLYAPTEGRLIPLSNVQDTAFSQGMLGPGVAIKPSLGLVQSPADGKVEVLQDSGHAICIKTDEGAEVLIHVGIDTVKLHGVGFKPLVCLGDRVKAGTPLIAFDLMGIQATGYDTTIPIVICNMDEFSEIELVEEGSVDLSDKIISLRK